MYSLLVQAGYPSNLALKPALCYIYRMLTMRLHLLPSLFILLILASCSSITMAKPTADDLTVLGAKELEGIEKSSDIGTWYNAIVAARRKGIVQESYTDDAGKRLIQALKQELLETGPGEKNIPVDRYVKALNLNRIAPDQESAQILKVMEDQLTAQFRASGFERNTGLFPATRTVPGNKESTSIKSIAEAMKSLVTIWVDKGFRVDRGMGIPDRVIGSGFFIEKDGLILTNYHVIQSEVDPAYEGFSKLYIRPSDRPEDKIPATVLAWDRLFDLALLKTGIDAPQALAISGNDDLEVGTAVRALGSPGGLENTVTTGIVSARGRRLLELDAVMQVDSAINPGNSGGPLLGPDYSLAGVVFAGVEQFEGINFAIPTSLVRKVLAKLFWGGEIIHPWLGVQLHEHNKSVLISYVFPGSPADRLGIEAGDRLLSINGNPGTSIAEAQRKLIDHFPGEIIELSWQEGSGRLYGPWGKTKSGTIALEKRAREPLKELANAGFHQKIMVPLFGFSIKSVSQNLLGMDFVVDEVIQNSLADESNISPGDALRLASFGTEEDRASKISIAYVLLSMQKRKSGFADSAMQLATFLSGNNYL